MRITLLGKSVSAKAGAAKLASVVEAAAQSSERLVSMSPPFFREYGRIREEAQPGGGGTTVSAYKPSMMLTRTQCMLLNTHFRGWPLAEGGSATDAGDDDVRVDRAGRVARAAGMSGHRAAALYYVARCVLAGIGVRSR